MSDPKFSLISIDLGATDLGKFAKPVAAFIERLAEHFERKRRPEQMVREAEAQRRVDKELALGRIEVGDIEHRARLWSAAASIRHQENIEEIVRKAIPDIGENAAPEAVDADWLEHFFDRARLVSGERMQTLWARILAGEATTPGSCSRRTVELVSVLDRKDAELFTALAGLVWVIGDSWPMIKDSSAEYLAARGLTFQSLTHLDEIGLVTYSPGVGGGFVSRVVNHAVMAQYSGSTYLLTPTKDDAKIRFGTVKLTSVGRELLPLAGGQPCREHEAAVLERLDSAGFNAKPFGATRG